VERTLALSAVMVALFGVGTGCLVPNDQSQALALCHEDDAVRSSVRPSRPRRRTSQRIHFTAARTRSKNTSGASLTLASSCANCASARPTGDMNVVLALIG
jgi:hypothetical protein